MTFEYISTTRDSVVVVQPRQTEIDPDGPQPTPPDNTGQWRLVTTVVWSGCIVDTWERTRD